MPRPLLACVVIVILCWALSTLVALSAHPPGTYPHSVNQVLGDAYLPRLVRNFDLLCYVDRFKAWGTAEFYQAHTGQMFNYAPPAAVALKLLYLVPLRPASTFGLVLLLWLLVASTMTIRAFTRTGLSSSKSILLVLVMLAGSFPLLALAFLSNFELFVWIVLTVGLWAFLTGRLWLAAFCFALAGSFKYFPLIFLGLFFNREHWRKLLFGLASCTFLIAASLLAMGPSIAIARAGLSTQMNAFTSFYLYRWQADSSPIDHSLMGAVKLTLHFLGRLAWMPTLLHIYLLLTGAALLLLFCLHLRKLPVLNQILAFTVSSVWLVPLSHDYTLVHLYAPLVLMALYALRLPSGQAPSRSLALAFYCLAILFSYLSFIKFHGALYGGQFRSLVLAALFLLSLRRDLFPAAPNPRLTPALP